MKRICWLTYLLLEFVKDPEVFENFCQEICEEHPGAILIRAIPQSQDLVDKLLELVEAFSVPIYFVFGNHDFYYGAISAVRAKIRQFSNALKCPEFGGHISIDTAHIAKRGGCDPPN